MIDTQMSITHCHRDIAMAENALQREDITAIHHVVASEGVVKKKAIWDTH